MKVRGAYMAIREFLYTYKQGVVYTEKGTDAQDSWHLESGRKVIIPDYQREYRWSEKQLTELVEDISKGNCYLGQIAVSRNTSEPGNYYLVDGQQRITSIIILLTVLCRRFFLADDEINIKCYELHSQNYNDKDPTTPRLCFEANCFDHFQQYISQIYTLNTGSNDDFDPNSFEQPTKDLYAQRSRYINACSVLNKEVGKQIRLRKTVPQQLEYVKDIISKVLATQVSVVVFEGDSSYESEKVFLDINEKGLRLDNEDILKAYYFQSVSGDKGKAALETWTSLKQAYFKLHETLRNNKMPLEIFVSYALQAELLMHASDYAFASFDDDLRYKDKNEKRHICQLLTDTQLHKSMGDTVSLLIQINDLLVMEHNSPIYVAFFKGRDATTREIGKLLLNSICRSEMRIIYIAFIKLWWLRNSKGERITFEDIIQLFSFYIIGNVSGLKKEKPVFKEDFMSAQTVEDTYKALHIIEISMLREAFSKSTTLKRDQNKAEYLSFNIQMFYNDFVFDMQKNRWALSITNQEFIAKYSSNRARYVKDHFLIQNGDTIILYNGFEFSVTQSMKLLRKRAYNFIYHEDVFGNIDFVKRLEAIRAGRTGTVNLRYGQYENDYFCYIEECLQQFFKSEDDRLPSWPEIITAYQNALPEKFMRVISYILEERSSTWNRKVCEHFESQFPLYLKEGTL